MRRFASTLERQTQIFFLLLSLGAGGLSYLFGSWAVDTWQGQMHRPDLLGWLVFGVQTLLAVAAGSATALLALASLPEGDPLKDDHWCELLFREHKKEQLRAWAGSLRYFRFVRGSAGGMDDHGDCLLVALRAPTLADAVVILGRLGATMHPAFSAPATWPSGQSIESTTVSIGALRLIGYRLHDRLELSLADADNPWQVTQAAVNAAQSIEPLLDPLAMLLIDPPKDDRHCLCPRYYPSFWASHG